MQQFVITIDLKPHAKFHKNSMKALRERTILSLSLSTSMFPLSCNNILALIFTFFFNILNLLGISFKMGYYLIKQSKTSGESKQNVYYAFKQTTSIFC